MDFKIVLEVGQDYLRRTGPMVPAKWAVTPEREAQLKMLGGTIPKPVSGVLLLDTGAGHSTIDREIVTQLKLQKLGKTEAFGLGGTAEYEQYEALLVLPVIPITNPQPNPVAIAFPVRCPETTLKEDHLKHGYTTLDGKQLHVIGILGRSFLQFTKIYYDGVNGTVEMYIDKSASDAKIGTAL